VASAAQPVGNAPPAPAAMPSAMNKHKGMRHCSNCSGQTSLTIEVIAGNAVAALFSTADRVIE
jgi:hypothetical protein